MKMLIAIGASIFIFKVLYPFIGGTVSFFAIASLAVWVVMSSGTKSQEKQNKVVIIDGKQYIEN